LLSWALFCWSDDGRDVLSNGTFVSVAPLRVLVAEDESIIRLDLCEMLERNRFIVCAEARNGEEAVELARSMRPDVVILDIGMPKLDGIEAARRILAERRVPIVMLTGDGREEVVAEAVEVGVYAYLVKPFRERDVVPAIRAARARHSDLVAGKELPGAGEYADVYLSGYGYTA
jgi:response regulator NasT